VTKAICGFTFSGGLKCQLPPAHKSRFHQWEDVGLRVRFTPWGPRDLTRKRKETLKERVFEFVASGSWRSEDTVIRAFQSVGRPAVEDALFDKVFLLGNSVCPEVAEALVRANVRTEKARAA
jgi:hypothetical protein